MVLLLPKISLYALLLSVNNFIHSYIHTLHVTNFNNFFRVLIMAAGGFTKIDDGAFDNWKNFQGLFFKNMI